MPPALTRTLGIGLATSLLGASCTPVERGAPAGASATATASATTPPPDSREAPEPAPGGVTLQQLQGRWKVRSSSGQEGHGHAFLPLVGQTLIIEADRLTYQDGASDSVGAPFKYPVTKTIALPPGPRPQAINLDLTPDMKGWSRVGIVAVQGNTMTLHLTFPQNPRPTSLTQAGEDSELVVLDRLPAP